MLGARSEAQAGAQQSFRRGAESGEQLKGAGLQCRMQVASGEAEIIGVKRHRNGFVVARRKIDLTPAFQFQHRSRDVGDGIVDEKENCFAPGDVS